MHLRLAGSNRLDRTLTASSMKSTSSNELDFLVGSADMWRNVSATVRKKLHRRRAPPRDASTHSCSHTAAPCHAGLLDPQQSRVLQLLDRAVYTCTGVHVAPQPQFCANGPGQSKQPRLKAPLPRPDSRMLRCCRLPVTPTEQWCCPTSCSRAPCKASERADSVCSSLHALQQTLLQQSCAASCKHGGAGPLTETEHKQAQRQLT